jgi:hypothetical protein
VPAVITKTITNRERKAMTDNDIREYIEGCEQPLFLRDVVSELTSKDPTVSWKRVARILREMGYENKPCKNARNPKGKGSVWTRGNAFATSGEDDEVDDADEVEEVDETEETEATEAKTRSTAHALHDVDAQNAVNAELSARLFESLNRSRDLKEELMRRQKEALLELARRILGIYGSERERRSYGGF